MKECMSLCHLARYCLYNDNPQPSSTTAHRYTSVHDLLHTRPHNGVGISKTNKLSKKETLYYASSVVGVSTPVQRRHLFSADSAYPCRDFTNKSSCACPLATGRFDAFSQHHQSSQFATVTGLDDTLLVHFLDDGAKYTRYPLYELYPHFPCSRMFKSHFAYVFSITRFL